MNDNAKALYEDLLASRLPAFDMKCWCGTAHCIGGEASIRMGFGNPIEEWEWLGLSEVVGLTLFYPETIMGADKLLMGFKDSMLAHPSDSPWEFLGSESAYECSQPQAAIALKRACEMSESELAPD